MNAEREVEPELCLVNRQRGVPVNVEILRELVGQAASACLRYPGQSKAVLPGLDQVEVSLVSDRVIAGVHRRFMNIAGATDVITFAHGEIVVSAATAAREALERGETLEREILRYVVHGLLHLHGHEDQAAGEAAAMWEAQEAVVRLLWPR